MARGEFDIDALLDGVDIKNRVVDGPVFLTYNARQVKWEPGEVKRMPRALALWFQNKSMFHLNPGDYNEGIPSKIEYKLAIIGQRGEDESDITREYVLSVKELLDVQNMPQLQRIDPKTGLPMRRVYIDPRSTGGMSQSDNVRRAEEQVTRRVSSAIVHDAAEKIADAAQGVTEADIEAAVGELTGAK